MSGKVLLSSSSEQLGSADSDKPDKPKYFANRSCVRSLLVGI